MSSIESLHRRVETLNKTLKPQATIVNCTGAKDELKAKLEKIRENSGPLPILSAEESEEKIKALKVMLAEKVKRIERDFNVRFVSYE